VRARSCTRTSSASCPRAPTPAASTSWYGFAYHLAFCAYDTPAAAPLQTYDLSKDPRYHECPQDDVCALHEQVEFYMNTYANASIVANVGYEVGQPAYPAIEVDKENQLPLTQDEFSQILANTQPKYPGAFFWSVYKKPVRFARVHT